MKTNQIKPIKALNKAFRKVKPSRNEIETFKAHLIELLDGINEKESEEFHKKLIADFFNKTYYGDRHFINTKKEKDFVIHNGKDAKSTVGVILEAKKPTAKGEMLKVDKLNVKALQQLVLYFLRERIVEKNLEIKHLIVTNVYEWFIFDAGVFEKHFVENKELVKQFKDFEEGRLSIKNTSDFYKEIAAPAIEQIEDKLSFTYLKLRESEEILKNPNPESDRLLIPLFKIFSPEHLLKLPFANDSNTLDKGFYSELLHIIGLEESSKGGKKGGKKLIQRQEEGDRYQGTLIENAIIQLESSDKVSRLEKPEQFGVNDEEILFNVALELALTWINRVLFLKLLEAQLIGYHKGDKSFGFLNLDKIPTYNDLNGLFFDVLAKKPGERNARVKDAFAKVPYLNSSLFEATELEQQTIVISNLGKESLPLFGSTVLKDRNGNKRTGEINGLEYLFEFLDAYDFSSEGSEDIQEENKTLISASVLGLIFEKINGYQDGSFFTPGFITMYMSRETIRRAVVQKFNEVKGWNCQNIEDLYDKIDDKQEANVIINSLKICDPAVGSGHFLVSVLNEIIAIKSELKILLDRAGKTLRDYRVEVENDELIVSDDDGNFFEYYLNNPEKQRVQEALFHEKQTLIENCLFGVDINPNSVKICRLRLWIELLKNAYYKDYQKNGGKDSNYGELETLPNIDINIKCGNSLISRFALDDKLQFASGKTKRSIESYRRAVQNYRRVEDKKEKRQLVKSIEEIKGNFRTTLQGIDPNKTKLRQLEGEVFNLENQTLLFEESEKEKKGRERKIAKLNQDIDKLKVEIEEIESAKVFDNAFEWRFEFPEALNDDGDFVGFDVVIGNPPYVRQEQIKELKPALQREFGCYTGVADLFVYFYERGMQLLKPGGAMTFITSNKYFRAGYGEKLRQFLAENATIETLIDFGDASVFEAIAYPTIISLKKTAPKDCKVKALNWQPEFVLKELPQVFEKESFLIQQKQLTPDGWRLESKAVLALLDKLRGAGMPLGEYVDGRFYRGILTGYNEAFVVDRETRDKLIAEHPSSEEVLKPFLRGRDVKRWCVDFAEQYLIKIESSENKEHPWSGKPSKKAEDIFAQTYPAIYSRFSELKTKLVKRSDQGRHFWELRSCSYYREFEEIKITVPAITKNVECALDDRGYVSNDKASIYITKHPQYLLGVLNSKVLGFVVKKVFPSKQNGFYEFKPTYVSQLPIPAATDKDRLAIEKLVQKCLDAKGVGVEKWEAEISDRVANLYGLTAEEMKIIKEE